MSHAVIDGEVMELGQVLVHSEDLLMFDGGFEFGLGSIALFLLFNEFLNFRGVQSRWCAAIVLDLAGLDNPLDLGLDVAISQVLLIEKQLRVLPSERRVIERRLGRV